MIHKFYKTLSVHRKFSQKSQDVLSRAQVYLKVKGLFAIYVVRTFDTYFCIELAPVAQTSPIGETSNWPEPLVNSS